MAIWDYLHSAIFKSNNLNSLGVYLVHQAINQSVNRSHVNSINQWINQSVNILVSQSVSQATVNQSTIQLESTSSDLTKMSRTTRDHDAADARQRVGGSFFRWKFAEVCWPHSMSKLVSFCFTCTRSIKLKLWRVFQGHQPITEADLHLDHVLEHVLFSRLRTAKTPYYVLNRFSVCKWGNNGEGAFYLLVDGVKRFLNDHDGGASNSMTGCSTIFLHLTAFQEIQIQNIQASVVMSHHQGAVATQWSGCMVYPE